MDENALLLRQCRRRQLAELTRETRLFAKRAQLPEDRVALAELERELLNVEQRWLAAGMIDREEQPCAA